MREIYQANKNKKTPSVSASDNMKSKAKSTKSNKGDTLMKVTILQNDMISMILNNPVSKHKANADRNQEEMSNSTAIDEGAEIYRSSRQDIMRIIEDLSDTINKL